MRRLIEFPLEDGSSVVAEVDEPDARTPLKRGDRLQESVERASHTFEVALDQIKPAAAVLISKLRAIRDAPAEVQVEFGLKLSAAAGALIASTHYCPAKISEGRPNPFKISMIMHGRSENDLN